MPPPDHFLEQAFRAQGKNPDRMSGDAYENALDPAVARALADLPDSSRVDISRIAELRREASARYGAPSSGVDHSRYALRLSPGASLDVSVTRPRTTGAVPCLYWIHGGGYISGSFRADHERMDGWAGRLDCAVVSVDYRLAPEHKYPVALDDCYAGLQWTIENAPRLNIDASRLVVAGASAGGGLAAALALLARDRGLREVCAQMLLYPMLDDRFEDYPSSAIQSPRWGKQANIAGWTAYLGFPPGGDGTPAYAAAGRTDDLSGAPSAFIAVAALDVLRDEALLFGARLLAAGVNTQLHVYPGVPHGFEKNAPHAAVSMRLRRDADEFLLRMFAGPP